MSAPLKVGEVAIGQNFVDYPEHNGEELLVIGGAELCVVEDHKTSEIVFGVMYEVEAKDGEQFSVAPYQLRRRRPPQSDSHERTFMQMWRDLADKAPQKVGEPC